MLFSYNEQNWNMSYVVLLFSCRVYKAFLKTSSNQNLSRLQKWQHNSAGYLGYPLNISSAVHGLLSARNSCGTWLMNICSWTICYSWMEKMFEERKEQSKWKSFGHSLQWPMCMVSNQLTCGPTHLAIQTIVFGSWHMYCLIRTLRSYWLFLTPF